MDYSPTAVTLLVQPATGTANLLKVAGGSFHFNDPAAAGLPYRFYQIQITP